MSNIDRFINMHPKILDKVTDFKNNFSVLQKDDKSFLISDETTFDEIYEGDTVRELRMKLNNRIAKKLTKKLSNEVEVKYALFAPKDDELVRGIEKGKKSLYLPFLLVLKDGQVLQAYGKNKTNNSNKKTINYSRPTNITHWYLNGTEITTLIDYSAEQSDSELVSNLARVINITHNKFIKKNKDVKDFSKEKEELISEIGQMIKDFESKQEKIKALQAEYNPREAILGTNAVAGGDAQATDVRQRNQEIKKELKELGGEVPADIKIKLPKGKPQTQQYIITLLEDDMMKYGKNIIAAFKKDGRLKDISYRFQFENDKGFKKTIGIGGIGGIGGITLDSIDAKNIIITLANGDDGEPDAIKEVMVGIITKVSKDIDVIEYSEGDFLKLQSKGDKKGLSLSLSDDGTVHIAIDSGAVVLADKLSADDAEKFVDEYESKPEKSYSKKIEAMEERLDYDFNKFNSITDLNDYEKALDDLVKQLEADGTVDANEDKLNEITLKFADMMMGK